jgi:hypothetical protein
MIVSACSLTPAELAGQFVAAILDRPAMPGCLAIS